MCKYLYVEFRKALSTFILFPRLERFGVTFRQLLPNHGDPNASCRWRGFMRSMALYGAPVWAHDLKKENSLKTEWVSE